MIGLEKLYICVSPIVNDTHARACSYIIETLDGIDAVAVAGGLLRWEVSGLLCCTNNIPYNRYQGSHNIYKNPYLASQRQDLDMRRGQRSSMSTISSVDEEKAYVTAYADAGEADDTMRASEMVFEAVGGGNESDEKSEA
jgi:hypothetical protein